MIIVYFVDSRTVRRLAEIGKIVRVDCRLLL